MEKEKEKRPKWRVSLENNAPEGHPQQDTPDADSAGDYDVQDTEVFQGEQGDEATEDIVSFHPVSLNFLLDFWREIMNREKHGEVELYTLTEDVQVTLSIEEEEQTSQQLILKEGTTVKQIDSEPDSTEEVVRCFIPPSDQTDWKVIRTSLPEDQLAGKKRKHWTMQDLYDFLLFEAETMKPDLREFYDPSCLGEAFQGEFVVYPRDYPFIQLLDTLQNGVSRLGYKNTSPAEKTFFWIDLFCVNFSALQFDSEEETERLSIVNAYVHSYKRALKQFQSRLLIFDSWDAPSLLTYVKNVWELVTVFDANIPFSILVGKQLLSQFREVYLRNTNYSLGIFDLLELLDPSKMKSSSSVDRLCYFKLLTTHRTGFSFVLNCLKGRLSRWYTEQAEQDVKDFPESRDHIEMEKSAIFLCKTGNFMRRHKQLSVSKSYFTRALLYCEQLQKYKQSRPRTDGEEISLSEQEEIDRINGSACRANVYLAHNHIDAGDYGAADRYLKTATAEALKIKLEKHHFLNKISDASAELHLAQRKHKKAVEELQALTLSLKDSKGEERMYYAGAEFRLGVVLREVGDIEEAAAAFQRAVEVQQGYQSIKKVVLANTLIAEAALQFKVGKHSDAIPLFQQALGIYTAEVGTMNVQVAKLYSTLGQCYARQGREQYNTALDFYRKCIESFQVATGPASMGIATALNSEGVILTDLEQYTDAVKPLQQAIQVLETDQELGDKITQKIHDKEEAKRTSLTANVYSNLGQAFEASGKLEEAIEAYKRAYEITEEFLGPDHEKTTKRLQRLKNLQDEQ